MRWGREEHMVSEDVFSISRVGKNRAMGMRQHSESPSTLVSSFGVIRGLYGGPVSEDGGGWVHGGPARNDQWVMLRA
ncbi:hypothetical protein C8034_v002121 [Colletotrichum sidae]|uniref:Uncharacterized protein n=1 Tax=Colletotrichum sidae TaxID=1347389 RepID=A0A4R8TTN8_9PEZI|nr:hypothetical protein C8034_v002121 [Colletotrichum sidae]